MATLSPLVIGVLVERRYLAQAQPSGMIEALRDCGHTLRILDPDAAAHKLADDAWLDGLDLLVCRGRSWGLLCMVSWAEARGVLTINRHRGISGVHNKAEMSIALATGRIPTPHTYIGLAKEIASLAEPSQYPLILKPIFGDNCKGLLVVRSASELERVHWPESVALAQQYLPSDGYDLKLYVIGDEVWSTRKPSPFGTATAQRKGHPVPLTDAWRDLALRCGRIFGLELYGLDCIETPEGPVVIEVNDFPNYTGVPTSDARLAEYVTHRGTMEVPAR